MLSAAGNRYGNEIDDKARMKEDGSKEDWFDIIAALFNEPVFHNCGAIEDDGFGTEEITVELGEEMGGDIQ